MFKTTVGDQVATTAIRDAPDWDKANIGDYLRMEYSQTFDAKGHTILSVDQSAYITKVVESFELEDCTRSTKANKPHCLAAPTRTASSWASANTRKTGS